MVKIISTTNEGEPRDKTLRFDVADIKVTRAAGGTRPCARNARLLYNSRDNLDPRGHVERTRPARPAPEHVAASTAPPQRLSSFAADFAYLAS